MMDLHAQLAPIAAEAARTGVKCLPEWLVWEYGEWCEEVHIKPISDDAARMIAEAGMWRFCLSRLSFRGWAELYSQEADFSALVAATLKVYAALPNKENA